MMVATADGIIARDRKQNVDWSSKEDKKLFVEETKKSGAVIFGENTYQAIGRHLPNRLNLVLTMKPEKYREREIKGELEFFKGSPLEVVQYLTAKGFASAVLGGGAGTNAQFLKANIVDELILTIEPKLFGQGMNFTEGEELDINLCLTECRQLNTNTVMLRYKIIK